MPAASAARLLATSRARSAAAAGTAHAAALEQVVPSTIRLLYQEGRYIEGGVSYTDPDQSGDGAVLPPIPADLPRRGPCRATPATSSNPAGTSAAPTRPTSTTASPTR